MKEIIAIRDKSFFILVTIVSLLSLIGSIFYLKIIISLRWFYLFSISMWSFMLVLSIVGLCFPNAVIIKKDNIFIINNGIRGQRKINISVILNIKQQNNISKLQAGNIILIIKTENKEKNYLVTNIKNVSSVIEKIKNIIDESKNIENPI